MNKCSLEPRARATGVVRALLAALVGLATLVSSGCLDRPVSPASPNTTNISIDEINQNGVDKIDLLFMVDNSISMADKQKILADAVPELVRRLVAPICVDAQTEVPIAGSAAPDCPAGSEPEFKPVTDIHIGVISSSLGGHGGTYCTSAASEDDHAHLIATVRPGIPDSDGLGFLWWNPDGSGGTGDANALVNDFATSVKGPGEEGCGFEASLEAWYRFLVDPQPPARVAQVDGFTQASTCPPENDAQDCDAGAGVVGTCVAGICADKTVLEQRRDFLRPDSLVAIIMLSDENDCSVRDDGTGVQAQGWLATTSDALPRATSVCKDSPDDPCCFSCAQGDQPGCPPVADDPECIQGEYDTTTEDPPNLRCWQQKRRFGVDWLYPTQRYVDGLTKRTIVNRQGDEVDNPLLRSEDGKPRDSELVFLAGIVGVPWQLVSTPESNDATNAETLDYLLPGDIDWSRITPGAHGEPPSDLHMVESVQPRAGLAGPASAQGADPITGHERVNDGGDLQYACTFALSAPQDCDADECDCKGVSALVSGGTYQEHDPLCQAPGSGAGAGYSSTQHFAKAYPGLRQLEVLKGIGDNAIVASICPKLSDVADQGKPSYGYTPAVSAIVEQLKKELTVQCVNRPISVIKNPDGTTETQCAVVEVKNTDACACDESQNRHDVDAKLVKPVLERLEASGQCGRAPDQQPCTPEAFCLCELGEATEKHSCEFDSNATVKGIGWCYIDADPEVAVGNPDLVKGCNPKRQLRFVGDETPANGSTVFIACLGKPL